MASFSAMYQKLREFLQEKDLAKTSGYQNQYAWEPFFPPPLFPYLRNNRKSKDSADLLPPGNYYSPGKGETFCSAWVKRQLSSQRALQRVIFIPSVTQEDITQQLLTSTFKTATQDYFYLWKSSAEFIILTA